MFFTSCEALLAAHQWELGTIHRRAAGRLPHWELSGATHAITFRLADSLPQEKLEAWDKERTMLESKAQKIGGILLDSECERLAILRGQRIQHWLDQGYGECVLRQPEIADLMQQTMIRCDGERYDLLAWCVMPNHVHVILRPFEGETLGRILQSWKGGSTHRINPMLGRTGTLWMRESFDRLIRNREHLKNAVIDVMDNPKQAGLRHWRWFGVANGVEELWKVSNA